MKLTDNAILKKLVLDRMAEIEWDIDYLVKDAESLGVRIDPSRWSRYKNGKKGGITDEQLLFICFRLYIPVQLKLGVPVIKGNSIEYKVPKFDNKKALELVNKLLNG